MVAGADSESAFCGFRKEGTGYERRKNKVDTTTEIKNSEMKKRRSKSRCECKNHGGFYKSGDLV